MFELPEYGACQCGSCEYVVNAPPYVAYTCHCKECQKLSSSAFSTCMQVAAEAVEITTGNPASRRRKTDSGNTLATWFCVKCGSALFSQNSARPGIRTVYVGTLENADLVEVDAHTWLDRKQPWVQLPDNHRLFPRAGDWTQDYADDIERYKPGK